MLSRIGKPLGLALLVVVVIGAICLFTIFGGLRNILGGARDTVTDPGVQGDLGQLYTALEVDSQGCPIERENEFYSDEMVFVGLTESLIPRGTGIFVRLYHEGRAVEDTQEIVADRDMDTCVWFEFHGGGSRDLEPGRYEAELIVNGNSVDSTAFEVLPESTAGGMPQTGSESAQFGTLYTSSQIDAEGCPVDDIFEFYSDETVYVALEESYIPAGTEMFARLIHEGRILEDTESIVASRDMESCVWFEFEGTTASGGLAPGDYEVEIYENGRLVDAIDFAVR